MRLLFNFGISNVDVKPSAAVAAVPVVCSGGAVAAVPVVCSGGVAAVPVVCSGGVAMFIYFG